MNVTHPKDACPPRAPLKACAGVVLAIAAFFGTARLIDRTAPPEIEVLPNKMLAFDQQPSVYNVAFLGSSHVYHQINPATFDQACAAAGVQTKSFNLGMPGWSALQISYITRQVLESHQPIKYLIIDPEWVELEIAPHNVRVQQTITWHDLPTSLVAARALLVHQVDWKNKLRIARLHALPFVYNITAFGRLQVPLNNWIKNVTPEKEAERRAVSLGPASDGFRNYTNMVEGADPVTKKALIAGRDELLSPKGKAEHAKLVDVIRAIGELKGDPKPITIEGLGDIQRQADAAGVKVIFITGPVLKDARAQLYLAHKAGTIRTFIPFNKPKAYPELYAFENQFDMRHLNAEGAEIYSKLIAAKFVEELRRDSQAAEPPR